jgi:hypothetical protein
MDATSTRRWLLTLGDNKLFMQQSVSMVMIARVSNALSELCCALGIDVC